MTKDELIKELHDYGETWADKTYTKRQLENYLEGLEKAQNMSDEELRNHFADKKN